MVLQTRIEIDTRQNPFKVMRTMPTGLDRYCFKEQREWKNFCDSFDRRLRPYQEIKRKQMLLTIVFAFFSLGIMVGIILRFFLVDDDQLGLILTGSMFAGAFLIFTAQFFLTQALIVKPLENLGIDITAFCNDSSDKWENVQFQYQVVNKCTIFFWKSEMDAWILVTAADPVDMTTIT